MSVTQDSDTNYLYQVLDVAPDATRLDIRKAYKKLAKKWHPDKRANDPDAADKLIEIRHAYEVLKDAQKREIYDQSCKDRQSGVSGQTFEGDLLAHVFGDRAGGSSTRDGRGPAKSPTIIRGLRVPLEDIYTGTAYTLSLPVEVICPQCDGRGGNNLVFTLCTGCNGARIKLVMRPVGIMIQPVQIVCTECDGRGEVASNEDRCKHCNGNKVITEPRCLNLVVEKGITEGASILFQGQGEQGPGMAPGDIIMTVTSTPARFQRHNDDLGYYTEIDLLTALAGGHLAIQHLDGRWLNITINPGEVISPGQVKVVGGEGMPLYRHHTYGNLYIKFTITFPPNNFNEIEKIMALAHILPPRNLPSIPPGAEYVEEVQLEDIDPAQQLRATGNAGGGPGANRARCGGQQA